MIEDLKKVITGIPDQKFEVVKVLGDAFSGVVVVRNLKLAARLENVKFITSLEPGTIERFMQEGRVLSMLKHEAIPDIYDIIRHEDMLLFRTEHIEGFPLSEVIESFRKKGERFPEATASAIMKKLMNALHYAHTGVRYKGRKASIIHCDIKPSNIILSADGLADNIDASFLDHVRQGDVRPYLIDFGVSMLGSQPQGLNGTLLYLSPAQATGKKIDWRTDAYQLSLVYHEMLTGGKPYDGLSRKRVLELKAQDFDVQKSLPGNIRHFIEKATRVKASRSFHDEKECLKEISSIHASEKRRKFLRHHKVKIAAIAMLMLLVSTSIFAYRLWDEKTQSLDAMVAKIEKNTDPSHEELDIALAKIQKRAFEKKYYEPLKAGRFREIETGKPVYPSHLDAQKNWVLVGPNDESAGAFAGLLFLYSDKYPDLLPYAVEYAEPVLDSEIDYQYMNRYHLALIPGYEKTHEQRYMDKLIGVADNLTFMYSMRKGARHIRDLYDVELFIWLYEETGDAKYLDIAQNVVREFIRNNIDGGYVYEYSIINGSTPYGPAPDAKLNRNTKKNGLYDVGTIIEIPLDGTKHLFYNTTSPWSRDYLQAMKIFLLMSEMTDDKAYQDAFDSLQTYYGQRLNDDGIDALFITYENDNVPIDMLATMISLNLFDSSNLHYRKIQTILSAKYLRIEAGNGIFSNSILISGNEFDNNDKNFKNQSLLTTDRLFLELKT